MKKTLIFVASLLVIALGCVFAFTAFANNECEHTDNWVVSVGSEGLLGEITFANICPSCGVTVASESYDCMFDTLGYSYSDNGGITQHYGVDRDVVARYEELTGETVKFGVVTATRNHVAGNPIDSNGAPVSNKVVAVDFTDTDYDVFDIIVKGIPEANYSDTEIICCAYVIVNGEVSYIDSNAQVKNAPAYTFDEVKQNHANGVSGTSDATPYKVVNGERYRMLTNTELGLAVGGYWNSTDANNYKYIIKTGNDASKHAYTSMLTKNSIPVGSIITIADDWQYRPEGWVNNAKNSTRAGYVTENTVFVSDAWWGNYTTRAFNITKHPSNFIDNMTADDISEIFQIYVPASAEIPANPVPLKQAWDEDGSLKILTIGNSYSDDAMEYVYNIAKELGVENVEIANLRANSCSLATHLSNAKNDTEYYMYRYWANGDTKWVDDGSWANNGTYKLSTAVTDADWDYIVFQQVSSSSTNASTYDDLNALIEIVEELNPTARYAWHMTWSNRDDTSASTYANIVNAVQSKIVGNEKIDVIIPVGTTVQNLRTSDLISGDPTDANKVITRDGWSHLSYGLGRYAAGLTFVKALTGISIDDIKYIPTADTEGHTFAYNNVQRQTVIKAVNSAIATPFAVTNIELSDVEEKIAELYAIENDLLNLTEGAFYNKNAGEYYFELVSPEKRASAGNAYDYGRYFATKMFTKETLPAGSVIYVASGYKYFVESWELDENGTPIAGTGEFKNRFDSYITTQYIVIDNNWWSGKGDIVAFNICNTANKVLSGVDVEDVVNIFKLYVPEEAIAKNQDGAKDADGKLYDPTPYHKPAYTPIPPIVNEDGLVRKDAIDFSASTEINGKKYYALSFEELEYQMGFYNCTDNTQISNNNANYNKQYTGFRPLTQNDLVEGMILWTKKSFKTGNWETEGTFYPERGGQYSVKDSSNGDYIAIDNNFWTKLLASNGFTQTPNSSYFEEGDSFEVRALYFYHDGQNQLSTAFDNFRIYVPEDMIAQ